MAVCCLLIVCCTGHAWAQVPDWVVFPDKDWKTLTPEEAGIHDVAAWDKWVEETRMTAKGASFQGEDHRGDKWGAAVTRGGYLIETFGDPDYKYQTAAAKAFVQACLQLAIDKGAIKSGDELIKGFRTGEGELNARHKFMTEGEHVFLTCNHLRSHTGAFPITNGHSWKLLGDNYGQAAPKWSKVTKDPDHDNYAHAKPGTVGVQYSSGGYWRLAQALTAVWDENVYSKPFRASLHAAGKRSSGLDLTVWQEATTAAGQAFDTGARVVPLPTKPKVAVLANEYEPGRGHVVIVNWIRQSAVQVDLSSIVSKGVPFTIHAAKSPFDKPLLAGQYNGPVSIPIRGREFDAFLVRSFRSEP